VFYQLLSHLVGCKQVNIDAFTDLMKAWKQGWYDSKKKLFIALSRLEEGQKIFDTCGMSFVLETKRINRRVGGVKFESCSLKQLTLSGESISIPQFSHAMFLILFIL
jgi:hypothetical protein